MRIFAPTPLASVAPVDVTAAAAAAGSAAYAARSDHKHSIVGMTLIASSDTPVAITATVATDIVTISGLAIPAGAGWLLEYGHSKTNNTANTTSTGIKVNGVQDMANAAALGCSATQRVESGFVRLEGIVRAAGEPGGLMCYAGAFRRTANDGDIAVSPALVIQASGPLTGIVSSLTITGLNNIANNALTITWWRLYQIG